MLKEISIISALPKPPRALSRRAVIYCRNENLWEERSTREITLPNYRLGWNAAASLNVHRVSSSKLSSSQGTVVPLDVSALSRRKKLRSADCSSRPSCSPNGGLLNTSSSKSIHFQNISQSNSFAAHSPSFSDSSRNRPKRGEKRNYTAASFTAPTSDYEGIIMQTTPRSIRILAKVDNQLSEECSSSLNFVPYGDPHATQSLVSRDPLHLTWRVMRSFPPLFLDLYEANIRHKIVHEVMEMVNVRKDQVKVVHLCQEEDASLAFTVSLDLSDLKDASAIRSCEAQLLHMSWSSTAMYLQELQSTLSLDMVPEEKMEKNKGFGNTEEKVSTSLHVNPSQEVCFRQSHAYTSHYSDTINSTTAADREQPLHKASVCGDSPLLQIPAVRKGKNNGKKKRKGEGHKSTGSHRNESLSAADSSWKIDKKELDNSTPNLRSSFKLTVVDQSETRDCHIKPNRIPTLDSRPPWVPPNLEDVKDEGRNAEEEEKWNSSKGRVSCYPSHSLPTDHFRSNACSSNSSSAHQGRATTATVLANNTNTNDVDKFSEQKDPRRVRSELAGKSDSMQKKSDAKVVSAVSLHSNNALMKNSDLCKPSTTVSSGELLHPNATKISGAQKVSAGFSTAMLDSGIHERKPSASSSNIKKKSQRKPDEKEKTAKSAVELGSTPSSVLVYVVNHSSHSESGESCSDRLVKETEKCNSCSLTSSIDSYSSGESFFLRTSLGSVHEKRKAEEESESCENRSISPRSELSPLDDSHLFSAKSVQRYSFTRAVGEGILIIDLPQNFKRDLENKEGKVEERLKLFFDGSPSTLTVRQVKQYVAEHIDVDPTTLALYYRGQSLSDEMEGSTLHWRNESVVTVVEVDDEWKAKKKEIGRKRKVQRSGESCIGTDKTKEAHKKKNCTSHQTKRMVTTRQREANGTSPNANIKKKYDHRSSHLPRRSVNPHTAVDSLSNHFSTVNSQKAMQEDTSPYPQQCTFNPYPHSRESYQSPPDEELPISPPESRTPLQMSEKYKFLTENRRGERNFEEGRDQFSEEETEPKQHAPCPFS